MPPPPKRLKPSFYSQSSFSKMDVDDSDKMGVVDGSKINEEDSGGQQPMGMKSVQLIVVVV